MSSLIGMLLVFIIILALMFGSLCSIAGEEKKGNTIVVNCITAIVLYMLVIELFNTSLPNSGIFTSGIPLINSVERVGSVKNLILDRPGIFAIDFVELVALTLMINWVSTLFSFDQSNFTSKIISRIIIVLGGVIGYGFLMDFVRENIVIKWCVYAVECIITGGSILYTPIMLVSFITGLKTDNVALVYFMEQLPKTSIGKAISASISSSVLFIVFLIVLETQYGSVCTILNGVLESMESLGAVVVMIMGIYIVINSIKKKG